MPTTWFTSDLHLGHESIIRHCDRPFAGAREMDDALIANVNALVAPGDRLVVLGDFSMEGAGAVRAYRARIRCRNVSLVLGNHDCRFADAGLPSPWSLERDLMELKCEGVRFELLHYPMEAGCWNRARRGSVHLHGHIHSRGASYNEAQRDAGVLRYDVGVDANGYLPVSAGQVLAFLGAG